MRADPATAPGPLPAVFESLTSIISSGPPMSGGQIRAAFDPDDFPSSLNVHWGRRIGPRETLQFLATQVTPSPATVTVTGSLPPAVPAANDNICHTLMQYLGTR